MPRGGKRRNTGGLREGAGRKPLGAAPLRKVAVTLAEDDVERLRALGGGNLSAGVRKAAASLPRGGGDTRN